MAMTDREMLELAAKAAGYVVRWYEDSLAYGPTFGIEVEPGNPAGFEVWNPKSDDGDSFRLACALRICIAQNNLFVTAERWERASRQAPVVIDQPVKDESQRAQITRDVVLRAAAEIGKAMQEQH